MKTSIWLAAALVAASGATAAAATNNYFGSDTLEDLTKQVLINTGVGTDLVYLAGGSGVGQAYMLGQQQNAAPMSKMMTNGICTFNGGTAGSNTTNASGIVVGLDSVDILSSFNTLNSGCNGSADGQGAGAAGLAFSGTNIFGASANATNANQNWKDILALVYGGKDNSLSGGGPNGFPDCGQPSRVALVNNWSKLFQNGCAQPSAICQALPGANNGTTTQPGFTCKGFTQLGKDGTHPFPGLGPACTSDANCPSTMHCNAGACGNTCGGDGSGVPLWHAFRRDDGSGTSDIFATLLGLSPSVSQFSLGGFGATPYCNAMNWDNTSSNATCNSGNKPHDQFVGPAGIPDPYSNCTIASTPACLTGACSDPAVNPAAATAGCVKGQVGCSACAAYHRKPPQNLWGNTPNQTSGACQHTIAGDATLCQPDVWPTDMQDNDPVRRACQGAGGVLNPNNPGEEVCNLDGSLGLVLAMPAADFLGSGQYVTAKCLGGTISATPPTVLACGPSQNNAASPVTHQASCPSGDSGIANCGIPSTTTTAGTGQCTAQSSKSAPGTNNLIYSQSVDGRAYNFAYWNSAGNGTAAYQTRTVLGAVGASVLTYSVAFHGGAQRVHTLQTLTGAGASSPGIGCQMTDETDQIGCLVQADPCAIGYAGDGGKKWNQHPGITDGTVAGVSTTTQYTDSARVFGIAPQESTVNVLGQTSGLPAGVVAEYPAGRKLYYNSIVGFPNFANTSVGITAADELHIAKYESSNAQAGDTSNINTVVTNVGYFNLGPQSPAGANVQFCEDFNEQMLCSAGSNNNGCTGNAAAGVPTTSTTCGDGTQNAFEECDLGAAVNGTSGAACSNICRCAGGFAFNGTTCTHTGF